MTPQELINEIETKEKYLAGDGHTSIYPLFMNDMDIIKDSYSRIKNSQGHMSSHDIAFWRKAYELLADWITRPNFTFTAKELLDEVNV